jgi:cytochrome c oxidase assembly factor CtaG
VKRPRPRLVQRRTARELAVVAAGAGAVSLLGGLAFLNAALPGAAYAIGAERVRRSGRAWPVRRTVAFLGAVVLLAAATSAAADDRASESLAWHMAQQMTLLFPVALGLVAGRPDALIGRGVRWSPSAAALGAAWLAVAGIQWVVHVPAVLEALARRPAALAAVHWLLVLAGVAFFASALAALRSGRFPPPALGLYVVSLMAGTDAIGLWLLFDPNVVYERYAGPGAVVDQERAGGVMFAAGMVPLLLGAGMAYRWIASPKRPAAAG